MKKSNGYKEIEHPKSQVEVLSNSREAIESYASATGLSFQEAAMVLVFNELRCIHWHYDAAVSEKTGV